MTRMDKQKIKGTQGGKHNKENPRRELEWIYKNKTETAVLVRRPIVRYSLMRIIDANGRVYTTPN